MLKSLLVLAALSSPPQPGDFNYNFPGCNGGGGHWPQSKISVPNIVCVNPDGVNQVTYTGQCNGSLTLSMTCSAGEVQFVDIADCFCD